jgi:hypothetical protein
LPQAPQLCSSFVRLRQLAPQRVNPGAQAQTPLTQFLEQQGLVALQETPTARHVAA